jgi:hypothetical protein
VLFLDCRCRRVHYGLLAYYHSRASIVAVNATIVLEERFKPVRSECEAPAKKGVPGGECDYRCVNSSDGEGLPAVNR